MNRIRFRMTGVGILACAAVLWPSDAHAQKLDKALQTETQINRSAQQSQKKIDGLSEQTQRLFDDYRDTNQQIDTLRVYNKQLSELIEAQDAEIGSLLRQIDDVTVIERQIRPLMLEMVDALAQFVELDSPFLLDERRARVAFLRDLIGRADVPVSEQYRRVMEAFQIENDYGRAVDAYRGTLEVEGQTKTVDFLKIGRVAYLYLTLDGSDAGVWDRDGKGWVDASDYASEIRRGLRMANKQVAFDLLTLPVPAPQGTRSEAGE